MRSKRLPVYMNDREKEEFFRSINLRYANNVRNYAMIRLWSECGLRVQESCGLKLTDIDWEEGKIFVHGKGDKDRYVWMNQEAKEAVWLWIERRREEGYPESEYLFVTRTGKRVDRKNMWRYVNRHRKKAGINKEISPHKFRHTFATQHYHQFKDILCLRDILGHSNSSTTDIYAHICDEDRKKSMQTFGR